ncbi:MAG: hypothetical protein J6W13_02745 [Salinivirgaceae bacterium]|nr:hypothetical protein [Salinivirgaceae bacterium]
MKKITTLVAALLLSVATFAQAPQGFSYQAVVRDAQNAIVANQTVDVDITITAEVDGTAVQTYTEKHSVTTNANGLLTLVVGQGESSQKLSDIKWSMPGAIYNMRTETKYGTATTQLLSVPFAMYAEQAGELDYQKLAKTLSSSDVQELLGYVKAEDLEAIRKLINDSLAAYGNTYIKKTDVNVLTKNYVTQEVFESYVVNGSLPDSVDLSVYAKKTDLPNMSNYVQMRMLDYYSDTLNQIRSEYAKKNFVAENYVTKEAFDNYVLSGGDAESVDLTVYAKTADVENTYAKKADIPSLSGYALKSDIPVMPSVPTKVSELQNDVNYLTSHQDISGKQDVIDDLDDIRSGAALGATALQSHQDISGKANKSEMSITPGANSGTAVIKLQNDMQETVLTAHQSLDAYAKTADVAKTYATQTEVAGKVDKDGNKVLSTNDFTNELKTKLESGVLTEHQDITGKADKNAMSIVPGTGENADKATITLKEGTSATVLTAHQSLEDLTQQIAALQNQLTQLQNSIPSAPDLSAYAQAANVPNTINVTVKISEVKKVGNGSVVHSQNTTIKLFDILFEAKGSTPAPIERVYKLPAYSLFFLNIWRAADDPDCGIWVNGERYSDIWSAYADYGFATETNFDKSYNVIPGEADLRTFLRFQREFKHYDSYEGRNITDGYAEKWIFGLPGEDCTIEITTGRSDTN